MQQTQNSPDAQPTYVQISDAIARDIMAGRLLDGEKLPPERAMAGTWGVAVGTLRKALGLLEEQGHLSRVQGSGNYVRHVAGSENIYAFFRLELLAGGGQPSARLLSLGRRAKPPGAPHFGPSADGFRIRRLRFLDAEPVALEEIWIDGALADTLDPQDMSQALYQTYKSRFGLWITRAEDRLGVGTVPDWGVSEFGPKTGAPTGYIERTAFDQNAAPVEFSRTWFDASIATYVSRLK